MVAVNLLALLALVSAAVHAAKYTVWVGYEDMALGLNINKNIPATVKIHPGDTVVFKQRSHDPHTVTFHPGTALPDLFQNGFDVNPQVATPTVFNGAYNGSTFATSGMMARDTNFPTQWEVTFSTEGKFEYGCAVHGPMQNGSIIVVPKKQKVPSPAEVLVKIQAWKKNVDKRKGAIYNEAKSSVPKPKDNGDGTLTHYIRMGYAKGFYEFLSFFKKTTKASPGDKLEWYGGIFHTVSFLNGAAAPPLIVPQGNKLVFNPVYYTPTPQKVLTQTGFYNGGLFVDPTLKYTLTVGNFTGDIEYVCLPHVTSKMVAKIRVSPRAG